MSAFSQRRFRRIFRIAVALYCLRALVPAGFMLSAAEGQLHIVLCDAAAMPAMHFMPAMDGMRGMQSMQALHAGHAMRTPLPDESGHTPSHHGDNATCPYALSAGGVPVLAALPPVPFYALRTVRVVRYEASYSAGIGPPRSQTARAPPTLSQA